MRTSKQIYWEYLRALELAGREALRIVQIARVNADMPVENTTHGLRPIQEWIEQADHLYQEYVSVLATERAART
jgi:hypothetical protein